MSTDILSLIESATRRNNDVPHKVADGLKSASELARHEAGKALRFVKREAKTPIRQLKRDPLPAIVALVGALCAARLLSRRRH